MRSRRGLALAFVFCSSLIVGCGGPPPPEPLKLSKADYEKISLECYKSKGKIFPSDLVVKKGLTIQDWQKAAGAYGDPDWMKAMLAKKKK